MSLHVGEAIGDYRVIGIIGAGGMGQVFQVEHKITKRKEAMKVLLADLADETQMERFKREIEVQARLNHPNIAAVHNAFRLKDRLVLVLEFVEGQTLENLLRQRRPGMYTGIDYVCQTLAALSYAHQRGVVHRDVSPSNLMITNGGLVKLMDFGVAKSLGDLRLTDSGSMVGSLYYMAPEQVKGGVDPDPKSDIYSAGAILYEVVTGKKPFDYQDRFSLMVAQVEEQPRPPSEIDPKLPEGLDQIILRALEKDPSRRYTSAKDFLAALETIQQAPTMAAPQTPGRRRRRALAVGTAVAGACICALAGVGVLRWNQLREPLSAPQAVIFSVPSAPAALAAIPPTPQPEPREGATPSPAPAAVSPAVKKRVAAKSKVQEPLLEITPPEALPAEPQRAEAAPAPLPAAEVGPAPKAGQEAAEPAPPEPQRRGFWGRFHVKTNPFKKKKNDSALHSTSESSPDRQD